MISVVIPVRNEEESLATLHAELNVLATERELAPIEYLFIDDGSTDGSWRVLRELAESDAKVRAIRFRRNFGKAAALTAGFQAARGDVVFTLDGDLQDDPREIPRFLERLEEGFDLVSGWKRTRHDPWHKVFPSRVFNALVSTVTGCRLHDHNCGFKVYRREVIREVRIYGELHRFVPALAHGRGFRVAEIEVHHRPRRFGSSKYGVSRFLKGLLDLASVRFLAGFGSRPAHVLGAFGLGATTLGGLGVLLGAGLAVTGGVGGLAAAVLLLVSALLIGLGIQVFGLGLVAELVTSYLLNPRDSFSIAERIDAAGILTVEHWETTES